MKNKKKYVFFILITAALIFILSMILLHEKSNISPLKSITLEAGRYVSKDNLAWLELRDDDQFELSRHIATSYNPSGTYEIKGDLLILKVNDDIDDTIEFLIKENTLSYKSGQLVGNLIEYNEIFYLETSLSDYRPMISKKDFLYFDTGIKKKKLSEDWIEIGTISTVIDSSSPIQRGQSYYVANNFLVGSKIFARKQNYETLYVAYENEFYEYLRQEDTLQLSGDKKYIANLKSSVENIETEALAKLLKTRKNEFIDTYGLALETQINYNDYLEMDMTSLIYEFAEVTFIPSYTHKDKDIMTKLIISGSEIIGPYDLLVGDSISKIFEVLPKVQYGQAYIESTFSQDAISGFAEDADLIYIAEDLKDIAYLIYNESDEIIGVKYILNWETGGYTLLNFSVEDRIIIEIEISTGFM